MLLMLYLTSLGIVKVHAVSYEHYLWLRLLFLILNSQSNLLIWFIWENHFVQNAGKEEHELRGWSNSNSN